MIVPFPRPAKGNVQLTTPAVSYVYSDALVDESVAKKGFTARLKQRWNPSRCVGSLAQRANVAAGVFVAYALVPNSQPDRRELNG
jgi:hypothetical protein